MSADFRALCETLIGDLQEARKTIEGWAAYASSYFQQKHDLAGDLKAIDERIARAVLARYGTTPAPVPVPWCWLSEQRPAVGQLCQAAVLGEAWLEVIEGRWYEQQDPSVSGFSHACGLFVSDPKRTLWRPLPEEVAP